MTKNSQEKYSLADCREFEQLLIQKRKEADELLEDMLSSLKRHDTLEDGAESEEIEQISQFATRQRKFIKEIEAALLRIRNGTYGVCIITGKLISKERLKVVPHTRYSFAAKISDKDVVR